MNSTADGKKIKEFRERLGQAMSRFEVIEAIFLMSFSQPDTKGL